MGSGPWGPPISTGCCGAGAAGRCGAWAGDDSGAEAVGSAPASEAFCIAAQFCQNPARGTILTLVETEGKTTLKPLMRTALEGISLEDTGIVRVRGADAVKFLQGQLSNDIAKLSSQQTAAGGVSQSAGTYDCRAAAGAMECG